MTALNVLVIDDSAVVRQVMTALLGPTMTVRTAADPLIAMTKMESSRPDVIVLDLEMPRMDGLTFLRKVMEETPLPVVVCSSFAESSSELTTTSFHTAYPPLMRRSDRKGGGGSDGNRRTVVVAPVSRLLSMTLTPSGPLWTQPAVRPATAGESCAVSPPCVATTYSCPVARSFA